MEKISESIKRHKMSTESIAKRLTPITLKELMSKNFGPVEWLVDGLIPAGSVVAFSGYPGHFKTWLMLDLAVKVALGDKFLNHFAVARSKVLYIDEENGERQLNQRLKLLGANNELPIDFLSYKNFRLSAPDMDHVVSYCKNKGIKLVVLDSLMRLHDLEENSATSMSTLYDQLKKLKANEITVIFLHHNRKRNPKQGNFDYGQEMRGSSDILAFVDLHLSVYASEGTLRIEITKFRVAERPKPFIVKVSSDVTSMSFEYSEEDKREPKKGEAADKILNLLKTKTGLNQTEIIKQLSDETIGVSNIKLAIRKLVEDGKLNEQKGQKNARVYYLIESVKK